jgi:hypothetical protein
MLSPTDSAKQTPLTLVGGLSFGVNKTPTPVLLELRSRSRRRRLVRLVAVVLGSLGSDRHI